MYGSSKGRLYPPNDLGDGNMLNKTRPKFSLHSLSSIHFAKGTNIEDASDEVSDSLNILYVVNFRSKIVLDQIWHEFDKCTPLFKFTPLQMQNDRGKLQSYKVSKGYRDHFHWFCIFYTPF